MKLACLIAVLLGSLAAAAHAAARPNIIFILTDDSDYAAVKSLCFVGFLRESRPNVGSEIQWS
jgi:hypothetical protein